jgi:2-aminoadipate transaminase
MQRSVLRQMIAVVSRPGILSFAGGLPDPAFFPTADYGAALQHVLGTDPQALQYGMPYAPLKRHIVQLMAQRGIHCTEAQIFLTTGAQQGLDVLTRFLLNPDGQVMFEEVVYTGAQQVVAPFLPHILSISTDLAEGMNVDEVADYLAAGARPSFIYTIPDAHNPLGVSMSQQRREQLLELAVAYNVPIIEDDPYGMLHYGSWPATATPTPRARPLRALNDSHVFYLGSFSKIMAPSLRLGWIAAPEELVAQIAVVKEAADLESSALTQRAVTAYLDAGHLPAHVETLRQTYGRRRDAMLAALAAHFPAEARWTKPDGGMFIWVELPACVDTAVLLETAVAQENIAFIPGHAFTVPGNPQRNCLRLNFSNCSIPVIEDGIGRLGRLISQFLAASS